jgi:hypothetical protein
MMLTHHRRKPALKFGEQIVRGLVLLPRKMAKAGIQTGRILKSEKPADPRVQQFKAAKSLGITFPLSLLGRADERAGRASGCARGLPARRSRLSVQASGGLSAGQRADKERLASSR